jgi:hypothetical protein
MTCKEKLMNEKPAMFGLTADIPPGCPQDYGYLPAPEYCEWPYKYAEKCLNCWNREIKEENNEMKETTCPNYVPLDEAPRTSAEIKEEMDKLHAEYVKKMNELDQEYAIALKREDLEAAACELKALVDSYISAGFTREEAMDIVLTNIKALSAN